MNPSVPGPSDRGESRDDGVPDARSASAARPSGLRNPGAAVRGTGAGALAAMALVLLLAVLPLIRIGSATTAVWLVLGLALLSVVLLRLLRRPWAWWAAWAVPFGLLAAGPLNWSLAVLGVLFGLLWAYVLRVRRTVVAGRPVSGESTSA